MTQTTRIQRLLGAALFAAAFVPLSAFAEERPDWRTGKTQVQGETQVVQAQVAQGVRRGGERDLRGTVMSVDHDGDGFRLESNRGIVYVRATGGVPVYYDGRRYRVRDLERGDRVTVDLVDSSGYARARSVEVTRSISDSRYGRDDRYDRGRDRYDDRYDDRNDRYRDERSLAGQVVQLDARRDVMVVRVDRRDVRVDARQLRRSHGSDWERAVRVGEHIQLEGYWSNNGLFVAEWMGRRASTWDKNGDWRR